MASFFQPGTVVYGVANNTPYEIYGNSFLSPVDLRAHWYQDLVIAVAGIALVAWVCISGARYRRHRRNKAADHATTTTVRYKDIFKVILRVPFWRRKILKNETNVDRVEDGDEKFAVSEAVENGSQQRKRTTIKPDADFESTKSFGFCSFPQLDSCGAAPFDLCIIDLRTENSLSNDCLVEPRLSGSREDGSYSVGGTAIHKRFGAVDLAAPSWSLLEKDNHGCAKSLEAIQKGANLNGLALFIDSTLSSYHVNSLLRHLAQLNVSILIFSEPDNEVLHQLNFESLCGIVFLNASIMQDGTRRDFFQMENLRKCLGRCGRQSKARPGFFVGFLELWHVQPSAAVVRRAYKLAEFFGAVIQLGELAPPGEILVTVTDRELCLNGFDFLKAPEVVELQKAWNEQRKLPLCKVIKESSDVTVARLDVEKLCDIIPLADQMLRPYHLPEELATLDEDMCPLITPPSYIENAPPRFDFWQRSVDGVPFGQLGCFGIIGEVGQEHLESILSAQHRLRSLDLLNPVSEVEAAGFCEKLGALKQTSLHASLVGDLISGLQLDTVIIYKGLDSGFSLPDNGAHFWGVSSDEFTEKGQRTIIYVSQKSSNILATVLHTYLAHQGTTRRARFEEELRLAELTNPNADLPSSIRDELQNATIAELLYLLEQLTVSGIRHALAESIKKYSAFLLTDLETRKDWKALHSKHCLDGPLTMEDLLAKRLSYFARKGVKELPLLQNLVHMSNLLEQKMTQALFNANRSLLEDLLSVISEPYSPQNTSDFVEPNVELFGLLFFCTLRKLAFENVYLETTDRCPFYLSQPDQAGVFSELWVLGSQCEIYFGVYPRTLGEVTYNKYRRYLLERPPSVDSWNGKDVFTAFSDLAPGPRIEGDVGPPTSGMGSGGSGPLRVASADDLQAPKSFRQKLAQATSLAVFCVPAIIDICLLTFLGRGFYLTAFMNPECLLVANYALLTALLITSGVTGWVGSTGGFYLYSFAFDNLTFFMIERFSAGFAITLVVAVCGFIAFAFEYNAFAGFFFALYLVALTTFLNLLGIMATLNREGAPLSSGRTALAQCMTILFISPILSTFVNDWDLLIYPIVIYTFVVVLIIRFQRLCKEWASFTTRVPSIKEKDIMDWYEKKLEQDGDRTDASKKPIIAADAREVLILEVNNARERLTSWLSVFKRTPEDSFVNKLADGYDISMWLLRKESNGEALPDTYSSTWLIQLGLALANQRQLIKGLKQHSPFISYRYSKYDLGQNIGLFLIALLDHWVAIIMSARLPAPLIYYDARSRYAIACGLLYFLVGAVGLDVVLQRYWTSVSGISEEKLNDIAHLEKVVQNDNEVRNKRWFSAIQEIAMIQLPTFSCCTVLMWVFVDDPRSIITYFLYVVGYSGVLVFQFNRCFTTSPRGHVMTVFCAAALGFFLGCLLRGLSGTADFFYTYPIALNTASLPAAFGTWYLTRRKTKIEATPGTTVVVTSSGNDNVHAATLDDDESGMDDNSIYSTEEKVDMKEAKPETPETKPTSSLSTLRQSSSEAHHETNTRLLRSLCLGADVSTNWQAFPEDVRKAIACRVLGKPFRLTGQLSLWLEHQGLTISTCDQMMHACLEEFAIWRSTSLTEMPTSSSVATAEQVPELDFEFPIMQPSRSMVGKCMNAIVKFFAVGAQWIAIISGAAPDTGRELWYALRKSKFRRPVLWFLLKIWKACWLLKNFGLQIFLLQSKRQVAAVTKLVNHGAPRILLKDAIKVDFGKNKAVSYLSRDEQGRLIAQIHHGVTTAPPGAKPTALALYDHQYRLSTYQTYKAGGEFTESTSTYSYDLNASLAHRWPILKSITDQSGSKMCFYDGHGRVASGTITRLEKTFKFSYTYRKRPSGNSHILRATYHSTDTDIPLAFTVYWSIRPKDAKHVDEWVPSDKITRFVKTVGGTTYDTVWEYHHKRDPVIQTTLIKADGTQTICETPAEATKDEYGFHEKPQNLSFDSEDFLIYHKLRWLRRILATRSSVGHKFRGLCDSCIRPFAKFIPNHLSPGSKTIYRRISTPELRTILWTAWTKSSDFDAMSACYLDELILRNEPLLHKYWSLRDTGNLRGAAEYLDEHLEQIVSAIEPSNDASQSCSLLIKPADLFTMGLGKDANQITARPGDCYRDTHKRTSVIFSDNGCWPDAPGGVSNCRRDVVDGHSTIRNHALAESANDFGIPRYQIERNVNSVKVLPLWGLDGKTPYHGVFDNLLQTQVDEKMADTHIKEDVVGVFIPLLKKFVYGARCKSLSRKTIVECTNVFLQMHRYFELKDYNLTWNSKEVSRAWIEAWLTPYDDPNVTDPSECFQLEKPSMSDFRDVLNLYICYFFIYSVGVPEDCPAVFQSTHHGVSSLFGMILKIRKGTAWGIWDHAILWRETCLNVSPAQCLLPIPVQSMLLAGIRLACHMAYTHADVILPCTSVFNPDWERDLGTDQGLRGSRNLFSRKIDPIVNGIGNMDAFKVVEKTTSVKPTTIMLSNVQFIKDVKNAVLAADVIVNQFGFTDYQLKVYGAQDRQPSYALETETIITKRKLSGNVFLAGFGRPAQVLQEAWLFMNSSLSEGLPLAIGEAALAGVPIVATEVGATALVLTDADDPTIRYGEVVPPNDPESLARAQLSLLAMIGPWTKYCKDFDGTPIRLPASFNPENRKWIMQRMHDKTADRKALGLKLRAVVLRNFHGSRYLREHEQMYWIQRSMAEYRRALRLSRPTMAPKVATFVEDPNFTYNWKEAADRKPEKPWRLFENEEIRRRRSSGGLSRTLRLTYGKGGSTSTGSTRQPDIEMATVRSSV